MAVRAPPYHLLNPWTSSEYASVTRFRSGGSKGGQQGMSESENEDRTLKGKVVLINAAGTDAPDPVE